MTSASQFSLEEENFYKDIQDLVKKGDQQEKELSTFLQRYMDLLSRTDLDDEIFIINFTKAALILEATAKVYGNKVDLLWINLERVLEALKFNGKNLNGKKTGGGEGGENEEEGEAGDGEVPADDVEPHKKLPNPKRRKRVGDAFSSPDDFLEIDNISGLLGKNMNEDEHCGDWRLKFLEEIPNLFLRNKTDRKRVDLCLVQTTDDRDDSRLRDWILSEDNMLVKEMYTEQFTEMNGFLEPMDFPVAAPREGNFGENPYLPYDGDHMEAAEPGFELVDDCLEIEETKITIDEAELAALEEANNNSEHVPDAAMDLVPSANGSSNKSTDLECFRFPQPVARRCLILKSTDELEEDKVDRLISTRKRTISMRVRKGPCKFCVERKSHSKKGKRCMVSRKKVKSLDSYLTRALNYPQQPVEDRLEPSQEFYNTYCVEMKFVERLIKTDQMDGASREFRADDSCEAPSIFNGFDGLEFSPIKVDDGFADFCTIGGINGFVENGDGIQDNLDALPEADEEFPSVPEPLPNEAFNESSDVATDESRLQYQQIISDVAQNEERTKSQFERNKELGLKIANWHNSLTDKLEVSRKRGALNMDVLGEKIMNSFPEESSTLTFHDLVKNYCRRDVPRYFFASLQLANEGNVELGSSSSESLATDCMVIKRLRATRVRHELDEYTPNTNSPKKGERSRSSMPSTSKRKRRSRSRSSSSSSSLSSPESSQAKNKKAMMEDARDKADGRKRKARTGRKNLKRRKGKEGEGEEGEECEGEGESEDEEEVEEGVVEETFD